MAEIHDSGPVDTGLELCLAGACVDECAQDVVYGHKLEHGMLGEGSRPAESVPTLEQASFPNKSVDEPNP